MKKVLIIMGIIAIIVAITSAITIAFREPLTSAGIIGSKKEVTNTIIREELNGRVVYEATN